MNALNVAVVLAVTFYTTKAKPNTYYACKTPVSYYAPEPISGPQISAPNNVATCGPTQSPPSPFYGTQIPPPQILSWPTPTPCAVSSPQMMTYAPWPTSDLQDSSYAAPFSGSCQTPPISLPTPPPSCSAPPPTTCPSPPTALSLQSFLNDLLKYASSTAMSTLPSPVLPCKASLLTPPRCKIPTLPPLLKRPPILPLSLPPSYSVPLPTTCPSPPTALSLQSFLNDLLKYASSTAVSALPSPALPCKASVLSPPRCKIPILPPLKWPPVFPSPSSHSLPTSCPSPPTALSLEPFLKDLLKYASTAAVSALPSQSPPCKALTSSRLSCNTPAISPMPCNTPNPSPAYNSLNMIPVSCQLFSYPQSSTLPNAPLPTPYPC